MAARTRRIRHDDAARAKIQASQLVNRLQANALGKLKKEMSTSQVKAAEILLRKTLPDLTATELSGDADNPLVHEVRETIVDPSQG